MRLFSQIHLLVLAVIPLLAAATSAASHDESSEHNITATDSIVVDERAARPLYEIYYLGQLSVASAKEPFLQLEYTYHFHFSNEGQVFVTQNTATCKEYFAPGSTRDCTGGACTLVFQTDGNLVMSKNGVPYWSSGTANHGYALVMQAALEHLRIYDCNGNILWMSWQFDPCDGPPAQPEPPIHPPPFVASGFPAPPVSGAPTPSGCTFHARET